MYNYNNKGECNKSKARIILNYKIFKTTIYISKKHKTLRIKMMQHQPYSRYVD